MPSVDNPNAALNARRYRQHKGGDHSLCLRGGNCPYGKVDPDTVRVKGNDSRGVPVIPDGDNDNVDPAPSLERGFKRNGQEYWRKMQKAYDITPEIEPLLVESCRMIDRLDHLHETLNGRGSWLYLRIKGDPEDHTYNVVMNSALREARESATALRGLVAEIRTKLAEKVDKEAQKNSAPTLSLIDGLRDDLGPRRIKPAN